MSSITPKTTTTIAIVTMATLFHVGNKSSDEIVDTMSDLIKSVIFAANKLKQTQDTYHDAAITLQQTIAANSQQAEELVQIRHILHEGFRQSIAANQQQADRIGEEQVQIRHILSEGFRLPTDRNDEQS